jgi:hypothetical protein
VLRPRQVSSLLPLLPPSTVLRAEMSGPRRDSGCVCSAQVSLTQCQQVRQRHGSIGGNGHIDSLKTLIIGGPAAHQKIAHGNMNDLRLWADSRLKHAGGFIDAAQGTKEIKDVQCQNDIGAREDVTGSISGIKAMRIGEIKATTAVDHGHG